jgi:hypothetical protein
MLIYWMEANILLNKNTAAVVTASKEIYLEIKAKEI